MMMQVKTPTRTALIVEDEIFVALDLERILTDAGYDVVGIAADRAEAEQVLGEAAGECRFAFVDVNLRDGCTGPGIAKRMTSDHGVRVVFVTANPSQIEQPAPALGFVRKPFSEASILAAAELASGSDERPAARVLEAL